MLQPQKKQKQKTNKKQIFFFLNAEELFQTKQCSGQIFADLDSSWDSLGGPYGVKSLAVVLHAACKREKDETGDILGE